MDPAEVERLKREWTDRRVRLAGTSADLRRFQGRDGTVVTVNMNGRALVRFDGRADIGWYDVAIADLRAVTTPPPPEETVPPPPGQPPLTSATQPTAPDQAPPAPAKPEPKSILELARQQGAAKPRP